MAAYTLQKVQYLYQKNIADSSSAANIYIAEGTTVTGLQSFKI
jgi:hypothetical protein